MFENELLRHDAHPIQCMSVEPKPMSDEKLIGIAKEVGAQYLKIKKDLSARGYNVVEPLPSKQNQAIEIWRRVD